MKKLNKKGFGGYEFLTVTVVALILSAILLTTVLNNIEKESLKILKYNAKIMAMNVSDYNLQQEDGTIYLQEMIAQDFIEPIKNPFDGDTYCNTYESKITYQNNEKLVTLRCGNYLIENYNVKKSDYHIYKVSDWSKKKENNSNDKTTLYNVKQQDKKVFLKDYEAVLFLHMINKTYQKEYQTIEEVGKNYPVSVETFYRNKVEVNS